MVVTGEWQLHRVGKDHLNKDFILESNSHSMKNDLKSKSNHSHKIDFKSKSLFEWQNQIQNQQIAAVIAKTQRNINCEIVKKMGHQNIK